MKFENNQIITTAHPTNNRGSGCVGKLSDYSGWSDDDWKQFSVNFLVILLTILVGRGVGRVLMGLAHGGDIE